MATGDGRGMKREFPGAWYVDALPSGEYAVLFPGSHLQTHQGRIELPAGDEPLYHRITNVGGFQIAGQAHNSNTTWWWTADHGWVRKPVACGVSPVIFDNLGFLHISDCSIGSQGWRYVCVAGSLITGDETYSSDTPFAQIMGVKGLSEWTGLYRLGEPVLAVGQGHEGGGCLVWDGLVLRRLEDGPCRFIRAYRVGEQVSVAFWKEGFGAVLYWLTVNELRALSPFAPPIVTPVPQHPPEPIPVPDTVPNLKPVVERVRARYPTPLGARHSEFLADVVLELGSASGVRIGLYKKSGGTFIVMPSGQRVSQDIIAVHQRTELWTYDILGGGETKATPMWLRTTPTGIEKDISKFYEVQPGDLGAQPVPAPQPVPEPHPDPDVIDLALAHAALRNEVAALSVKLAQLEARVWASESNIIAIGGDQAELHNQMKAVAARTYRVVIDDSQDAPRLSTSKDFGHAHRIALKVEPIA